MDKDTMYKVGLDVIYLASCALDGRLPERNRLFQMDFHNVYIMSKRHSMQAIVYLSLSKALGAYPDIEIDGELHEKWKNEYQRMVAKLVKLGLERESLYAFLEVKGIWYVGLKGIVLSELYPTLGMRQMTDNDILVDPSRHAEIRDYFLSRGYSIYSYGTHCHDVYLKGNLTFEIHRMLAEDMGKLKAASKYYSNVKDRLIPDDKKMSLRFGDDDFYIYYIFHSYKHFVFAGCGLRTLMDIYVYNSKMAEKLDYDYIGREMRKIEVFEYESFSRRIADLIFGAHGEGIYSPELLSEDERELLLYYISSGTFGTDQIWIENRLADLSGGKKVTFIAKMRYLLDRLFPKYEFYKTGYPVASKFIVTIPVLWFIRLLRVFTKRKRIAREIKKVSRVK